MNHDEYEWQAQESALDGERRQRERSGDDPLVVRDRVIAAALAQAPAQQLPADFAAQVARKVQSLVELDTRFEQRVQTLLLAALALGVATVAVIYGAEWVQSGTRLMSGGANGSLHWLVAGSTCIGLSWLFARAQTTPVQPPAGLRRH